MEKFNLENLEKKHPFKVPDAYFDDLTERIQQRILDNSLNKDNVETDFKTDLLKNFDKKTPFGTPENYFESFSEKLNQRINQENYQENYQQENPEKPKIYTPKPLHTNIFTQFGTYAKSLAVAAALILVGSFAYVIYENNYLKDKNKKLAIQNKKNADNLLAFNYISDTEIVEYLQENHTDYNENYILENVAQRYITETDLQELSNLKPKNTEKSSTEILKTNENQKEKPSKDIQQNIQQKQDNHNIINDLPKEELKQELQEILNNGELEEEF